MEYRSRESREKSNVYQRINNEGVRRQDTGESKRGIDAG